MSRLEVGVKAPQFTLPSDSGSDISLKSLSGNRAVLYFYPADDTPGCTKEACQFNDLLSEFKKSKVQVLGISPDSIEKLQAFRKKFGLNFPLLSDTSKAVMKTYGAFGEKQLYGKTVVGVIRSTFVVSATGKIEFSWYAVRANGHAAKVLGELLH